jgi:hypothetical protein
MITEAMLEAATKAAYTVSLTKLARQSMNVPSILRMLMSSLQKLRKETTTAQVLIFHSYLENILALQMKPIDSNYGRTRSSSYEEHQVVGTGHSKATLDDTQSKCD